MQAGLKDKWLDDVMRETKMDIRSKKIMRRIGERAKGDNDDDGGGGNSDTDSSSGRNGNSDSVVGVGFGGQSRQPLTLTHLQGPFWLLLMGMVAALLALMTETMVVHCTSLHVIP